jgi:hypothetical protein
VEVKPKDLTIIYYSASTLREPFASNVRKVLRAAASEIPIISVTQKPLNFGGNILFEGGRSYLNIYRQILVGAKAAKTPYVALAEDDVLYSYEHFHTYLPPLDKFAYDVAKWSIYTWTKPAIYSIKFRHTNTTLIAPRELLIEALEERFAKYPDDDKVPLGSWSEPGKYEKELGVTVRGITEFTATTPCVVFSHPDAIGYDIQGDRKRLGEMKA